MVAFSFWEAILPLIGFLIYAIARGKGMGDRSARASELEKANALHSAGKLSDGEFAQFKAKILA